MRGIAAFAAIAVLTNCPAPSSANAQQRDSAAQPETVTSFQLPGQRASKAHRYQISVDISNQTPRAAGQKQLEYSLLLDCMPRDRSQTDSVGQSVTYTCREFSIADDRGARATIPALKDWSYEFRYPALDLAPEGNVFGLPNAKFQNLTDSNGRTLESQMAFLVYNAFSDYHVLCNVYAQELLSGAGIQDLKHVGDRITHGTSGAVAPLGNIPGLADGSKFVHGKVTLELKGIAKVANRLCALVGFEALENTAKMVFKPAPNYTVVSEGKTSHSGDLFIDLDTAWVAKAEMSERIVTTVDLNGKQNGPSTVHRTLNLMSK